MEGEPVRLSWVKIYRRNCHLNAAALYNGSSGFENLHKFVPRCLKVSFMRGWESVIWSFIFFSYICLCNKLLHNARKSKISRGSEEGNCGGWELIVKVGVYVRWRGGKGRIQANSFSVPSKFLDSFTVSRNVNKSGCAERVGR